jgi:hypothetical protein
LTIQPTITHTHTWDGTPNLPPWLHWDGRRIVAPGRDDITPPKPGWTLVRWSDGQVVVVSPQAAARMYGPHGLLGRLQRAEAALALVGTLADRWVKAGPPPLGTSVSRWWDARLIELNTALDPKDQP